MMFLFSGFYDNSINRWTWRPEFNSWTREFAFQDFTKIALIKSCGGARDVSGGTRGVYGGARGVMVIVVGNGHGDTSSDPGRD